MNREEVLKWLRTIALVLTMGVMGLDSNLRRAVTPDLLVRLNTTADKYSYMGAIGGIGGLFVPPMSGLFDRLVGHEELLTGVCHMFGALTHAARPYTLNLWLHAVYTFIDTSIFFGVLFSVCNSVVSRLWGEKSGRPMQALNLGWPIGALIGPLIAVPFVSEEPQEKANSTATAEHARRVTHSTAVIHAEASAQSREFLDDSSIEIAFLIAAGLTVFIGSLHFILYAYMKLCHTKMPAIEDLSFKTISENGMSHETTGRNSEQGKKISQSENNDECSRREQPRRESDYKSNHRDSSQSETVTNIAENDGDYSRKESSRSQSDEECNRKERSASNSDDSDDNEKEENITWRDILTPSKWAAGDGKFGFKIACLTVVFYMFLMFSAKGVGGFLVLYAVDSDLGFSNAEAARLQSAVFVFAIIGDTTAAFLAKYISVNVMLFIQVHGQFLCGFLMLGFGSQSKVGLWVTSCLYTSVREPSFASGYTWAGLHIVLYAFILSMISLLLGVTNIFMNALQGWLYTNTVIESIFYTTIFWGGLNCLVVYVMMYVTWQREPIQSILSRQREARQENSSIHSLNIENDLRASNSSDSDTSEQPLKDEPQLTLICNASQNNQFTSL